MFRPCWIIQRAKVTAPTAVPAALVIQLLFQNARGLNQSGCLVRYTLRLCCVLSFFLPPQDSGQRPTLRCL